MDAQQYQQQQQFMPQNPYGQERGLLQYQIDNEEIIDTIKRLMMNQIAIPQANGTIKWEAHPDMLPKINEIGMRSVEGKMRSRFTKVFSLSKFDDEQIEKLCLSFAESLVDELYAKWDFYNLRSVSDASDIVDTCVDNFYAILMKAKEGLYLRFLKTSQIVQESNVVREDLKPMTNSFEENRRVLPFLPFRKKS